MKELIEAYEEYIQLLSDEEVANLAFLYVHGIRTDPQLVEKGKELREKIKKLKEELL